MKINKWEVAQGASNLGEDDIKVAVLKVEGDTDLIKVAYCAYSGLKIMEIAGLSNIVIDPTGTGEFAENFIQSVPGNDWEVGFIAEVEDNNGNVIVTIDDCEGIDLYSTSKDLAFGVPANIEVISSEEYMVDQYDELDIDLLKIFSYI